MQKPKHFVIDTNVLIHNPNAIYSFGNNKVIIPIFVVEELDTFKKDTSKKGINARFVLRELDRLLHKDLLNGGARLKTGGTLEISLGPFVKKIPNMNPLLTDNKILTVAWEIKQKGDEVCFISKDVNARVKACALGIKAQDYENQVVAYDALYTGWNELKLPQASFDSLAKEHTLANPKKNYLPNECLKICSEVNPRQNLIGYYDATAEKIIQITALQEAMSIRPLNLEQRFAFELLTNPNISLVSLIGQAGTGKTLLALACGLEQVLGKQRLYEKLIVARPIMPLGKDIGYLPGSKDEKLKYWMQPIFDNLHYIFGKNKGKDTEDQRSILGKIDYLVDSGMIEIEAITYIRGRSIPQQFIIIDEAQNLTPHEVKTIISRAGEGSKIVLTGDPEQIDNPYLDANSNGLSYTAERLKNEAITGHITLSKSERSALASLAAEVL